MNKREEKPAVKDLPGVTGPCRHLGCTSPAYYGRPRCERHSTTHKALPAVTDALLAESKKI